MKPSLARTGTWCYSWSVQNRFDLSVNHVDFPGVNHQFHSRTVGRKARGLFPLPRWARTSRLRLPAVSPPDCLERTAITEGWQS